MPKKPTTSREDMIEGAFRLIREKGAEALTARNLAAVLGCSTQPVMYQFPDLSELREAVYQRADRYHTEYILSPEGLLETGMRYIRFAAEEPNLFRFLFQSGHFEGKNLSDMILAPKTGSVLLAAASDLQLPEKAAASAFTALFTAVHGYASLIANNAMRYDPEDMRETLRTLGESLMAWEKANDPSLPQK